jgi:hypothetical protein
LKFGKDFLPPTLRARAVDKEVAAVPPSKAIDRFVSRFGRNPLSPKAKEGLIVAVSRITLEASKTKAESDRCRAALTRARSAVSRAFVRTL